MPELLTMVAFAERPLRTICTGPVMEEALVLVTVMVADHTPVARLRLKPVWVTFVWADTFWWFANEKAAGVAVPADAVT